MSGVTIAVIGGTGREGYGLALRWAKGGYHVIIGSRDPTKARAAVERAQEETHHDVPLTGRGNEDAASAADIVVLTIPFGAHPQILSGLRDHVRGKVVVDTTVPLATFRPPVLQDVPEGSAAQRVQALLPEARVVAAFHTVSAAKLVALDKPLEQDTLLCSDDSEAKKAVSELARIIGLRPVDAGPLSVARTLEQVAALVIGLNQRYGRRSIGLRFVGL